MVGFTPTTPKFVVLAAKKSQKFPHAQNEILRSKLIISRRAIRENVEINSC
jgi:biotin operon repressor